jgi:hypothetical protein
LLLTHNFCFTITPLSPMIFDQAHEGISCTENRSISRFVEDNFKEWIVTFFEIGFFSGTSVVGAGDDSETDFEKLLEIVQQLEQYGSNLQ